MMYTTSDFQPPNPKASYFFLQRIPTNYLHMWVKEPPGKEAMKNILLTEPKADFITHGALMLSICSFADGTAVLQQY